MTKLAADDGIAWNASDQLMLWLLPPLLGYLGAKAGGSGWALYVAGGVGVVSGIAVVRGIEASINAHLGRTPREER